MATTDETAATAEAPGISGIRGCRYGEVLLLRPHGGDLEASVYNTQGLSDCPAELWSALDPVALAEEHGAALAVLNGPRYWLVDRIAKPGAADRVPELAEFGGIPMFKAATIVITPEKIAARAPYGETEVDRGTIFTWDAGSEVYELTGPDGTTYAMQSWSQQVDPSLAEPDLASLCARLALPEGWTYRTRVLDDDLALDTTGGVARVLQDELQNSYSRIS